MPPLKRAALFAAAPLLCLAVFWRAPFAWFRVDDFAWLSMYQHVHSAADLWHALFQSAAQGTVRVISERLYFLVLGKLFGITSWPYRVVAFGTWFLALSLMQLIGARLTGSRAAGLWSALLWTISLTLLTPLMWASAYNQILIAFVILLAFYCRLRWLESQAAKWLWIEGVAFLLGFGVLEIIVVYPAMLLAYTLFYRQQESSQRPPWRSFLWMFIPSAIFAASHLFLIPKNPSPIYALIVDNRLPSTLWNYFLWSIGPSRMEVRNDARQLQGLIATWTIAVALLLFLISRIRTGDKRPLFLVAWFLLFLAPVLPLPNHVTDYYTMVPGIGLAWLGAWGLVQAWRTHLATRAVAVLLAAAYITGSVAEIDSVSAWFLNLTSHIRIVVRAVQAEAAAHPGSAIVLQGVDEDVFFNSFPGKPFFLVGAEKVWLPPNADQWTTDTRFGDLSMYRTTPENLAELWHADHLRVIDVSGPAPQDITSSFTKQFESTYKKLHSRIEVGQPVFASSLGDGWYPIENGVRWSNKHAQLRLPATAEASFTKFRVTGYANSTALSSGPVMVSFKINDHNIGSTTLSGGDQNFEVTLALPANLASLIKTEEVKIDLECSKTFRPPNDPRDLGLVFKTFELLP